MTTAKTVEIEKAHRYISEKLKKFYDRREYRSITIHNALHSFEKYFNQYSHAWQVVPTWNTESYNIFFSWKKDDENSFDIKCNQTMFSVRGVIKGTKFDTKSWKTRENIMLFIQERVFSGEKLPIDPA